MNACTLRYRNIPDDAEIGVVEVLARTAAGRVTWQRNREGEPAYALVEGVDTALVERLRARASATVTESPIIACAVFPSVAEALPHLLHALGGPGRPAGVRTCEQLGTGILIEWDLEVTGHDVILGCIEIECARFGSARRTVLLSPLPLAWWTRIAAQGLGAPEIAPDRVLEALLEGAHVPH